MAAAAEAGSPRGAAEDGAREKARARTAAQAEPAPGGGSPPAKRRRKGAEAGAPAAAASGADDGAEAVGVQRSSGGVSTLRFGGNRRGAQPATLIDFITARFKYFSAEQWRDRMARGWLRVQPKGSEAPEAATPDRALQNGDTIILDTPREEEPAVDPTMHTLWRDDGAMLLGVAKSGNLPVSESGRYRKNTAAVLLEESLGRPVWTMHRLDKETSGCLLLGLSADAARRVAARFQTGATRKLYHAVLRGELQAPVTVERPVEAQWRFEGEGYCADCPSMRKIRWCTVPPGREAEGRSCKTVFRPLRARGGLTLAEVEIWQGRTHQIRVHAEHAGYPVLGDKVYGHGQGSESRSLGWMRGEPCLCGEFGALGRHLLHASRLQVDEADADGGRRLVLVADPLPEFRQHGGDKVKELLRDLRLPLIHGPDGSVLPSGWEEGARAASAAEQPHGTAGDAAGAT